MASGSENHGSQRAGEPWLRGHLGDVWSWKLREMASRRLGRVRWRQAGLRDPALISVIARLSPPSRTLPGRGYQSLVVDAARPLHDPDQEHGKRAPAGRVWSQIPPRGRFGPCFTDLPVVQLQLDPEPGVRGAGFFSATIPQLLEAALTDRLLCIDGLWCIDNLDAMLRIAEQSRTQASTMRSAKPPLGFIRALCSARKRALLADWEWLWIGPAASCADCT
ncbi:hypothetical protein P997_01677 [Pseudomonas aeruginosa 62]|nr:hypothetical protein P997_01677 [Pseudomonas aeruginosa 62]WOE59785.1 hypothetical protein PA12_gene4471 [Pseudomonas aeruginosa]